MKKPSYIAIILIFLVIIAFCSCSRASKSVSRREAAAPMASPAGGERKSMDMGRAASGESEDSVKDRDITQNRKIIRTAETSLYVENYGEAVKMLEALAQQSGGVVAGKSMQKSSSSIWGTLTFWIPAGKLLIFLDDVSTVGKAHSTNMTSEDISDTYYDMDARLKTRKKQEERLLSLLDKPDTTLPQILKLEEELARIRGDIETMEGQIRRWDKLAAYSTVTVHVTQDVQVVREPEDMWKPLRKAAREVKPTLTGSFGALLSFISGLILLIIALIPWAVPIALVVWIIMKVIASRRAKKEAQVAARKAVKTRKEEIAQGEPEEEPER